MHYLHCFNDYVIIILQSGVILLRRVIISQSVQGLFCETDRLTASLLDSAFCNASQKLAITDDCKVTSVYSLSEEKLTLVGKWNLQKRSNSLCFANGGKCLLAADKAGYLHKYALQELASNGCPKPQFLAGHISMLTYVVLSDDGKLVVTADRDEKIRVSHYPDTHNIQSFCLGHTQFVSALAFVRVRDGGCRFPDGAEAGSDSDSLRIPFSPDSPDSLPHLLLLSGGADASLRCWEPRSGRQLATVTTCECAACANRAAQETEEGQVQGREHEGEQEEEEQEPAPDPRCCGTVRRIVIASHDASSDTAIAICFVMFDRSAVIKAVTIACGSEGGGGKRGMPDPASIPTAPVVGRPDPRPGSSSAHAADNVITARLSVAATYTDILSQEDDAAAVVVVDMVLLPLATWRGAGNGEGLEGDDGISHLLLLLRQSADRPLTLVGYNKVERRFTSQTALRFDDAMECLVPTTNATYRATLAETVLADGGVGVPRKFVGVCGETEYQRGKAERHENIRQRRKRHERRRKDAVAAKAGRTDDQTTSAADNPNGGRERLQHHDQEAIRGAGGDT